MIEPTPCCGLGVYDGLNYRDSAREVLHDMLRDHEFLCDGELCKAMITYTTNWGNISRGTKFKKFIEKNGFGEVIVAGRAKNPNSENTIQVWNWVVNQDKVLKYAKKKEIGSYCNSYSVDSYY